MLERFKPIILGVDADVLRMPALDAASIWYLVYFLLAVVVGLLFLQWRLRKQAHRQALNNSFMLVLMRRGLTKLQLAAMEDFFAQLHETEKQEILLSHKLFAQHLQQYLASHRNLTGNDRVEIFDKVLPNYLPQIEVKTLSDLRPGELAAIDFAGKSALGTILRIKDNQILLSSSDKLPAAPLKAQVYAYRPGLGGFLLDGEITKSQGQSHIFQHSGQIEFRGDQHLMTIASVQLKLEPWPHHEIKKAVEGDAELGLANETFPALTEKLSDRAMVIRFLTAPPDWAIKKQELWEMTLDISEKPILCRVKMAPYRVRGTWLLRPVDLDSAERDRLFKFIAENEPVREHF